MIDTHPINVPLTNTQTVDLAKGIVERLDDLNAAATRFHETVRDRNPATITDIETPLITLVTAQGHLLTELAGIVTGHLLRHANKVAR